MSLSVSDEQFEQLIGQALDELPPDYVQPMLKDVAVTWAPDPSDEQRRQLKLRGNQTLFGLYEGVPRTARAMSGDAPYAPDRITVFKQPLCAHCRDMHELKDEVKKTVWHEMAHYYGLGHKRIHELE